MPMTSYGIRELAAKLGAFPVELKAELRPALDEVGELIGGQARENAAFSSKIPAQEFHKPSFSASGGGEIIGFHPGVYPHEAEARVMEGDGYGGEFRHPVYDAGGWAPQQSHPFLAPAVEDKKAEAKAIIAAAVRKALTI